MLIERCDRGHRPVVDGDHHVVACQQIHLALPRPVVVGLDGLHGELDEVAVTAQPGATGFVGQRVERLRHLERLEDRLDVVPVATGDVDPQQLALVEVSDQLGRQLDVAIAPVGVIEPSPDDRAGRRFGWT